MRSMGDVREPAVAGRFYPGDPERLAAALELLVPEVETRDVTAVLSPHAGFPYSGGIAGETYARVNVPTRVIVLCPNHTGRGAARAVWSRGEWLLPGGAVAIDAELAARLLERLDLEADHEAHWSEHAAEVQMPFLRFRRHPIQVVPICLSHLSAGECVALGRGIARVIEEAGHHVLLVASSDMSHYVDAQSAKQLDALALERLVALDPEGLHRVVEDREISMCGYVPATVALAAARELGASRGEVVRYGSSGDVTGDYGQVVGYAGALIH